MACRIPPASYLCRAQYMNRIEGGSRKRYIVRHTYIQQKRYSLFLERDNDNLKKADDCAHESGPECVDFKTFDKMFVPFHIK